MSSTEHERQTRKQRVDPRLKAAGWAADPFVPAVPQGAYPTLAVEEFDTANGPADYALCSGGRTHAVVEAKKLTVGPYEVLTQAERYSKGISRVPRYQREFGVPFLYSTNGEVTWFHDVGYELDRSRRIFGFHISSAFDKILTREFDWSSVAGLAQVYEVGSQRRSLELDGRHRWSG
jgi:type I restriction enzyme, R subunit